MKSVSQMVKSGKDWSVKNSPQILMFLGIGGMCTAGIWAVAKTPLALDLIEEEKQKRLDEWPASTITAEQEAEITTLKPVEIVKTCWKVYAPAVLLASVSTVCLVGSNSVSARRTAALATAYTLSEKALKEFKDKAVEIVGEKKVQQIKEEVVKDKYEARPVQESQIIITSKGETLCCDSLSMRYFKVDIDMIKKAENKLNLKMRNENYCSVNELYDLLGLEHTELGRVLGWNIERDGYIEIKQIPQIAANGQPCIYLDFSEMPKYEYSKLYY